MSTKVTLLYDTKRPLSGYHFYYDHKDSGYHLELPRKAHMKHFLDHVGKLIESNNLYNWEEK